jgi:hypothetical protein
MVRQESRTAVGAKRLVGKAAIITGAVRGIGRATAIAFARGRRCDGHRCRRTCQLNPGSCACHRGRARRDRPHGQRNRSAVARSDVGSTRSSRVAPPLQSRHLALSAALISCSRTLVSNPLSQSWTGKMPTGTIRSTSISQVHAMPSAPSRHISSGTVAVALSSPHRPKAGTGQNMGPPMRRPNGALSA